MSGTESEVHSVYRDNQNNNLVLWPMWKTRFQCILILLHYSKNNKIDINHRGTLRHTYDSREKNFSSIYWDTEQNHLQYCLLNIIVRNVFLIGLEYFVFK